MAHSVCSDDQAERWEEELYGTHRVRWNSILFHSVNVACNIDYGRKRGTECKFSAQRQGLKPLPWSGGGTLVWHTRVVPTTKQSVGRRNYMAHSVCYSSMEVT